MKFLSKLWKKLGKGTEVEPEAEPVKKTPTVKKITKKKTKKNIAKKK
tara:strand:+ start:349 stop:489 length:141 start_codon:yes stop_codon:yes gene_type:complete